MADLQIWKLTIDIALAAALIGLGWRWSRAGSSGIHMKIGGLESSLRMLIQDADNASQALNEKLLKRKSSLEKLLFDLETAEQRLNRSVNSAQEGKLELEAEVVKAREAQRDILSVAAGWESPRSQRIERNSEPQATAQPAAPRPTRAPVAKPPAAPEYRYPVETYEPASFKAPPVAAALEREAETEQPAWERVNIYGEAIVAEPTPALTPVAVAASAAGAYRPLQQEVEKEQPVSLGSRRTQHDVQRVYDAAERLLKTGVSLQRVAAETQLPLDEIRILSQMLQQEQAQHWDVREREDARLGVLGGMTRRVQTL